MFRVPKAWLICSGILALTTLILQAQAPGDALESNDAIARFGRQMAAGEVALDYREGVRYLPSLLERLGINIDSQVLVFSKTSFQHAFITPKNPRALYFNDNVAVGTVPGGSVYEMMALEPSRGLAFYLARRSSGGPSGVPAAWRRVPLLPWTGQQRCGRDGRGVCISRRSGSAGVYERLHQHDRSSDAVRSAVGRVVRHRHAWIAKAHGKRRRDRSRASG
jgi:hypothetical protein